jgi:hypothetical protein
MPDIFIDSGGFSAMTQGVSISLDEYADYLKRNAAIITAYANLDAIGDAEATLRNQRALEARGLRPIPVFHVGEDWRYLERYVAEYPYIALGGMVPHLRFPKRIMPWIIKCFKVAGSKAVFHGFGATNWSVIRDLPWYSADSTTWVSGSRFGGFLLFDARTGRLRTHKLAGDADGIRRNMAKLVEYGLPLEHVKAWTAETAKTARISGIKAIWEAEAWVRRRHGLIDLIGETPGFKAYLAANVSQVKQMGELFHAKA